MSTRLLLASLFSLMACWVLSAQTSSTLIKDDPAQQYKVIKTTLEQYAARGLASSGIRRSMSNTYDLRNCDETINYIGIFGQQEQKRNENLAALLGIALPFVAWENDFRKLGIPESVWEPILSEREDAALKSKIQHQPYDWPSTQKQLAAALNLYRDEKDPALPKFIVWGGCGSGEIEVHIALTPPDGQLFLIPVFLYKLCEAQHLNPADRKACDHWTEIVNGTASYVSGDYVYLARWADGTERCGPLGFKSTHENGKTFSITKVRSPECSPGW